MRRIDAALIGAWNERLEAEGLGDLDATAAHELSVQINEEFGAWAPVYDIKTGRMCEGSRRRSSRRPPE